MPGIVTHHVFGCEVYRRLFSLIGERECERDSFLLGNQGPDPLFYLVVTPLAKRYRTLASAMHVRATAELLQSMHGAFVRPQPPLHSRGMLYDAASTTDSAGVLKAYALGFLCHYLLDSTVHPLVYAQQNAICAHGVDGMRGRRAARAVHATIETELDEFVMTTRLGVTAARFAPHKTALRCSELDLGIISCAIASAVQSTYGQRIPSCLFKAAVHSNRVGQAVLDSKGAGLRRRVDYLRPTGLASAYVLSLSHVDKLRHTTPFANDEHVPWPHPTEEGATFSASFNELYQRAFKRALEELPTFAVDFLAPEDVRALVGGVNFLGRPLDNR